MNPNVNKPRGFLIAEAIAALALLALVMVMFAIAMGRQQKVLNRGADSRAALRLAEQLLTAMQTSATPPAADAGNTIRITKLATPADSPTFAWVNVQITVNGRSAELIG